MLSRPTKGRVLLAIVSLLLGAAISALKLWYHCRDEASEACVWGKAYYPLTLPLETLFFGLAIFLLVAGGLKVMRR